jgi:excisionase family DNA binding protein
MRYLYYTLYCHIKQYIAIQCHIIDGCAIVRKTLWSIAMVYLTVADVAKQLQISEDTVRRWIKSGKLPALKIGKEWRVDPEELKAFLAQSRKQPPT